MLDGEELGRGAMGTVLRGHHRGSRLPVAIKVLTGDRAREARFRASFEAEVRALAGLGHPAVLAVLDHGVIDARQAGVSEGVLAAGSPYLVMELASGGALREHSRVLPPSWEPIRATLRAVLQGLAHAHSRGIVHRDLKPANILLSGPADPRQGPKLADFGLAHIADETEASTNTMAAAGTPSYMAPEQFKGHFRDFGPWTDLYALGCLAFELVCGLRPFDGDNSWQVGWAHLSGRRAAYAPRCACPVGLEPWLDALIELRPQDRFQRAADALWALDGLQAVNPRSDGVRPAAPNASPTAGSWAEPAEAETVPTLQIDQGPAPEWLGLPEESDDSPRFHEAPAHPSFEDLPPPSLPSRALRGVGLGLLGLRRLPFVGREPLRRRLWSTLRDVRRTGQPQALLLTGGPGVGKSRLADWLGERAHEAGAATVLSARHGRHGGPSIGLPRMLARHLQVVGLADEAMAERVGGSLRQLGLDDPVLARSLQAFLAPDMTSTVSGPAPAGATPEEVFAALRQLLRAEAARRPVVLLLDDIGWGLETLEFARYLLDSDPGRVGPVLVVATARTGQETSGPVARRALSGWQGGGVEAIEVPPMSEEEGAELTDSILGLAPNLARQVQRRSGGSPLFALELVSAWVAQGLVELSDEGLEASTHDLPVPDGVHGLWQARVAAAVSGVDAQHALQCAAVLGREVERREWEGVCRRQGLEPGRPLLVGALGAHLLVERERRWHFAHPLLRESLERAAQEAGRLASIHRSCAALLESEPGRGRGVARRRAMHLLLAGEPAQALDPLQAAAREALGQADFAAAEETVELWATALDALQEAPEGRAQVRFDVLRSWLLVSRDRAEEAASLALAAAERARVGGWLPERAESLRHAGSAALKLGSVPLWEERVRAALAVAEEAGVGIEVGRNLRSLGLAAMSSGALGSAREHFDRARFVFERLGDERGRGDCLLALAQLGRAQGNPGAVRDARSALEVFEHLGCRYASASARNTLGELLRAAGRVDEAETMYRRAAAELDSLGSSDVLAPRLNLASLRAARGDVEGATATFEGIVREAKRRGRPAMEAFGHALLLPLIAAEAAPDALGAHLDRLGELLGTLGLRDPELAGALAATSTILRGRGLSELADRSEGLAGDQQPQR